MLYCKEFGVLFLLRLNEAVFVYSFYKVSCKCTRVCIEEPIC